MRIRVFSDIHLEFADWEPPAGDADVVVIAGDLHPKREGLAWISRHFSSVPVIYVAGNHEFYGGVHEKRLDELQAVASAAGNIRFLENASAWIGDVLFLGCTLWTDFNLFQDPAAAGAAAAREMTDYRRIRTLPHYRRLKGRQTSAWHAASRQWLESELRSHQGARIVVVTHHAPSPLSLDPSHPKRLIDAAYASHLDELVAGSGACLWIHGHTHRSVDYPIGPTRVFANQRGYPGQTNTGFDERAVVTVV
jgi:predicted phosphodiesterase